jgi:hypothetical protein
MENSAQRRASFAADRTESDDEVAWDEAEEEEDAGSQATSRAQVPLMAMKEVKSS